MKRIVVLLVIILLLVGCDYADPEELQIITAIGVVSDNNDIKCYIETSNSISDEENNINFISLQGDKFSDALDKANNVFIGKPIYSHCQVILIDSVIDKASIEEIFDLCLSKYDVSLSVMFVCCDVQKVFKYYDSKFTLGHDIVKLINRNAVSLKSSNYGKFSKIYNEYIATGRFALPKVVLDNKTLVFEGEEIIYCVR